MKATENTSTAEFSSDLAVMFSADTIVAIPPDVQHSEVFGRLETSLARTGRLPWESGDSIVAALLRRERYGTTGLGKGLALPHLRCRSVTDFVGVIGVAPTGVDFQSLDGVPSRLITLLLSPFDQRERHAGIMRRLAMLLTDATLQYHGQRRRSPESLIRFPGF